MKGLKARLALERGRVLNGTPLIDISIELHNVSGSATPIEFPLGGAKWTWAVTDADGKQIPRYRGPGNELTGPPPKLLLPNGSILRLPLTKNATGIGRNKRAHLDLGLDNSWEFQQGDTKAYDLGGSVTIPESGKGHWSGTLDLPKVPIPLDGR